MSVEGVPPSTIPNFCPLAKGVADPAVSAPDVSLIPLTNPDSAAPASKNLELFRGLSEIEQLHEQGPAPVLSSTSDVPEEVRRGTSLQTFWVTDTGNTICLDTPPPGFPPPGFQPRLILHQDFTPDMKEWLLLVALGVLFRFLLHASSRV
jgi:hypothetical protein